MIAISDFAPYIASMHTRHYALSVGWLADKFPRLVAAVFMVIALASPALAQEAPSGGRSGSLLNILLLGGIAYFLVRSFRRRNNGDDGTRPGRWSRPDSRDAGEHGQDERPAQMDRHDAARQMWDMLSSSMEERPEPTTPTGAPSEESARGFDEAEFLEGAKLFFARFQQASDERDFLPIRDFISDEMFSQAMTHGGDGPTEIMLLNAKLMEMKSEDDQTMASVYYDAQLRKGEQGERTEQVRTVWEFSRDDSKPDALWVLEAVNRVDH